ncbi:MAG TPA: 2-dehydro-3-deoxygalactonokinase [Blastocatellia bacterium]|jgi:2-dehydro-3-deoxygalactonokinase|nr:2-dehydro-3-deoxygalactonokinase [Blastocatellia bacterium]
MINGEASEGCLICVDAGTTNTRVWLTAGALIIARTQTGVGVRDTARDGSSERLRNALRELIDRVRGDARDQGFAQSPECVIAAGMITSPLGLAEVPHVPTPAGLNELAAAARHYSFPEITDLPILLIPGARSGPRRCDPETVGTTDVMRGEETLLVGLHALGLLAPRSTLLNLGSHWKVIKFDERARIASSVTSMTGELIHTAQTQTILAGSVPQMRPSAIDQTWLESGMREQRRSGLARALFCVRLLEQGSDGSAEQRLSFLIGAFLASDMDAMLSRRLLDPDGAVVIAGGGVIAEAWRGALVQSSIRAITLSDSEVENATLAGLRRLFSALGQ